MTNLLNDLNELKESLTNKIAITKEEIAQCLDGVQIYTYERIPNLSITLINTQTQYNTLVSGINVLEDTPDRFTAWIEYTASSNISQLIHSQDNRNVEVIKAKLALIEEIKSLAKV